MEIPKKRCDGLWNNMIGIVGITALMIIMQHNITGKYYISSTTITAVAWMVILSKRGHGWGLLHDILHTTNNKTPKAKKFL